MDIQALQATLRDAAGSRRRRPIHTPKNLAMALVVEAAGLLETFQWLTPDESQRAADDAARQQHIGQDLAGVLLVLVQLADHTRVDLDAAVRDRLAGSARRPAPAPAGRAPDPDLARVTALPQPGTQVLLDYENVQPNEDEVRRLVPDVSKLWLFHGPHQKQTAERFASFGDDLSLVPIRYTGRNSLDFHLSFYMGYVAARNPGSRFVVLANDKGYEPMLEHARGLGFDVRTIGIQRVARPRPARRAEAAPEPRPAARKTAPKRPPATPAPAPPAAPGRQQATAVQRTATTPARQAAAKTSRATKPGSAARTPAKQAAREAAKDATKDATKASAEGAGKVLHKLARKAPLKTPRKSPLKSPVKTSPQEPPKVSAAGGTTRKAPAPKKPAARKAPVDARRSMPSAAAKQGAAKSEPSATAASRAGVGLKIEQRLRQLGAKRPTRLARLRGVVKSLLGATAGADEVTAEVARLTASGAVGVDAAGDVSYPVWD